MEYKKEYFQDDERQRAALSRHRKQAEHWVI